MELKSSSKVLIGAVLVFIAAFAFVTIAEDSDADTLYSVTLDGNGGTTSGGQSSESYSVISGQSFAAPSGAFSKSGYILIGWSDSSTGQVKWHPGQGIPVSSDRKVYAVWQDLTYNGIIRMGGDSQTDNFESEVIYTSVGGQAAPNLDNTPYNLMKGLNRTSQKYGMTVTYCGDSKYSEATSKGTSISADWLTLNISNKGEFSFSGGPTREGVYTVDVTLKTKAMAGSYGDLDDLLVRWYVVVPVSADSDVSLVFDMDGGSGRIDSISGPAGTAIVLPNYTDSTGNAITRSGYTLVGWEIPDGRGSRSVYALGSLYTLAFDASVKAKWVSDPNVLVYSLDGGSLANVDAYVIHDGSSLTLRDTGVSKSGCTFLGWRPTQDRQIAYAPGLEIESSGPMYMEAYFVENGRSLYTITFDANGGQGTVHSQKVESGMYVKLPTKLCMVRDGFTFVGWSESSNGSVLGYEDYQVSNDVTLYAVWQQNSVPDPEEPEPQPVYYDVSFSTNQGQGNCPVQRIISGGLVTEPAKPNHEGHVFLGWRSLTQSDLWDFSKDTVTTDTILQAQWAEHFTISVDGLKVTVQLKGIYYDMAFDVDWGDIDGAVSETFGPSVGTATHTYNSTSYGYITVRSHDSSPNPYSSVMTYSVEGEHFNPPINHTVIYDPGQGAFEGKTTGEYIERIVDVGKTAPELEAPVWEGHEFTGWYFEGSKWDFSRAVTADMKLVAGWDDIAPEKPEHIHPIASFTITGTWHLDASGSLNAVSFYWYLDGKEIGSGKEIDIGSEGLATGTHTVKLLVVSSTGDVNSVTKQITVQPSGDGSVEDRGSWLADNKWIVAVFAIAIVLLVVRFWI